MLASLLIQKSKQIQDHDALVCGKTSLSYGELAEKIENLAWALADLGIGPGNRVALVHENTPEYVITFFAATAIGSIIVPLNPAYKCEELRHYFDNCQVNAVVAGSKQMPACKDLLEDRPAVPLIATGGEYPGTISFETLLGRQTRGPLPTISPEADAVYQYSSGSTGRPKRVPRTHSQLLSEAESIIPTMDLTSTDRIFCAVPLFHTHGQGNCMLASAFSGASLVLLEHMNPFQMYREQALAVIESEQVTVFPGVPFIFGLLANATRKTDLSALRLCFSAGSALPKETFDNFYHRFGVPIRQLYGCTEAGAITINMDENPEPTANSVGKPLKNVCIKIVDDSKTSVTAGDTGEIAISTPGMTRGYAGLADHNLEVFRDGFFYSGDLGRLDEEGRLWITGRRKLFIEVAGNKVDPFEVEDVLLTHPALSEAVVVGVPGIVGGGEMVKAVVVANTAVDEAEIKRYCFKRLAAFKVPMLVEFRDEIPKSPLGKVLRKYLV